MAYLFLVRPSATLSSFCPHLLAGCCTADAFLKHGRRRANALASWARILAIRREQWLVRVCELMARRFPGLAVDQFRARW